MHIYLLLIDRGPSRVRLLRPEHHQHQAFLLSGLLHCVLGRATDPSLDHCARKTMGHSHVPSGCDHASPSAHRGVVQMVCRDETHRGQDLVDAVDGDEVCRDLDAGADDLDQGVADRDQDAGDLDRVDQDQGEVDQDRDAGDLDQGADDLVLVADEEMAAPVSDAAVLALVAQDADVVVLVLDAVVLALDVVVRAAASAVVALDVENFHHHHRVVLRRNSLVYADSIPR